MLTCQLNLKGPGHVDRFYNMWVWYATERDFDFD